MNKKQTSVAFCFYFAPHYTILLKCTKVHPQVMKRSHLTYRETPPERSTHVEGATFCARWMGRSTSINATRKEDFAHKGTQNKVPP